MRYGLRGKELVQQVYELCFNYFCSSNSYGAVRLAVRGFMRRQLGSCVAEMKTVTAVPFSIPTRYSRKLLAERPAQRIFSSKKRTVEDKLG